MTNWPLDFYWSSVFCSTDAEFSFQNPCSQGDQSASQSSSRACLLGDHSTSQRLPRISGSQKFFHHNLRTKRDIFLRLRGSSHTGRNPRQLEHRGEVTGKRCAVSWIPEGKNGVSHIVAPRGPGVCLHAEDAEVLRHWTTCLRSKDIQDNSAINEKNDVLIPATTWMNLKIVVQSERSQAKENSHSIVPLIKPLEDEN